MLAASAPAVAPVRLRRCRRASPLPPCAAAEPPPRSDFRGASSPDGGWAPVGNGALGGALNGFMRAANAREPVQAGTPVLREKARVITLEELASPRVQDLIEEMIAVCRARGVGLAAPQLGEPLAIVVLEDTVEGVGAEEAAAQERKAFGLKVLVNPVVTARPGAATACFFEGCLSVQGYRGLVCRPLEVDVAALGADGAPLKFTARGWQARAEPCAVSPSSRPLTWH